ncbi:MAG: hypothetical protein WC849_00105 [Candidatus Paceibacterota bacterium]
MYLILDNLIPISLFQILLAFFLLRISGEIGKLSLPFGYASLTRIDVSGNISFNLFFRILFVPVSLAIVSILLYWLNLDFLIKNIWIVSIWYFLFQFIYTISKISYVNLWLYFISVINYVLISYFLYKYSLSQGLDAIIPSFNDIRTEMWIIVALFFYELCKNFDLKPKRENFNKKLENKYLQLNTKYKYLLNKIFLEEKILNDILFSIMIFEDLNRPKLLRIIEKLLFKIGIIKTTGIMQIKSGKYLNDEESIKLAQEKITKFFNKNKILYKSEVEYELVGKILVDYNPDAYYRDEVRYLYFQVSNVSRFFEEERFSKSNEIVDDIKVTDINEFKFRIKELITQINIINKETNLPFKIIIKEKKVKKKNN